MLPVALLPLLPHIILVRGMRCSQTGDCRCVLLFQHVEPGRRLGASLLELILLDAQLRCEVLARLRVPRTSGPRIPKGSVQHLQGRGVLLLQFGALCQAVILCLLAIARVLFLLLLQLCRARRLKLLRGRQLLLQGAQLCRQVIALCTLLVQLCPHVHNFRLQHLPHRLMLAC